MQKSRTASGSGAPFMQTLSFAGTGSLPSVPRTPGPWDPRPPRDAIGGGTSRESSAAKTQPGPLVYRHLIYHQHGYIEANTGLIGLFGPEAVESSRYGPHTMHYRGICSDTGTCAPATHGRTPGVCCKIRTRPHFGGTRHWSFGSTEAATPAKSADRV